MIILILTITKQLVKRYQSFMVALWLSVILMNLSGCLENEHYSTNVLLQNSGHNISMLSQEGNITIEKILNVHLGVPSKNLPPYFIYWNRQGIEQEILHEAFKNSHYQTTFSYHRNREDKFLKPAYHLDCISTVTERPSYDGFYSDDVIIYQDVAIYLKDSKMILEDKADLADKRIEAFKEASKHLDIQDIVANNPSYHEHSGRASQIVLLYRGKVDVLLMDKYLFFYFRNKVNKLIDMKKEIVIRHLFPKRAYKILCKQQKVRDDFNQGLAALRATGRYEQIIENYIMSTQKIAF